jgi:uroporphyrinogen-III synthase
MAKLVLLTRPLKESEAYAQELQGLGFETMIAPMLELAPQDFEMPEFQRYKALIFTSGNGVRFFAARTDRRDLRVFTVGDQTREAALEAGFTHVSSAGGAGADLVDLIARSKLDQTRPLLHVRGYHTALPIHIMLQERGYRVDLCVVYKAETVPDFSPDCLSALREGKIAAIPFFSKRTAENFLHLIQKHGLEQHLSSINALSIGARVLECVQSYPWRGTYVSDQPDKASMTQLLQRVCV